MRIHKIICDKCNKELPLLSGRISVVVHIPLGSENEYDICEDCFKEIEKFFEDCNQ